MSESNLSKDIQIVATKYRCILYRNNSGKFKDRFGRWVSFGLGNVSTLLWNQWKTSDLVGYTIVTVTPDMIGRELAVFTAIEVKLPDAKVDARYKAQKKFIDQVKNHGGIAAICNSVESLEKLFKDFFTQD